MASSKEVMLNVDNLPSLGQLPPFGKEKIPMKPELRS
jgi:hypothetical protein